MTKEELRDITKEEFEAITKEELIDLIKACITDCTSLLEKGNVTDCMDKITAIQSLITTWSKANVTDVSDDIYKSTCDMLNKNDVRIQNLDNIVKYIEATAWYTDGTGFDIPSTLVDFVEHIATVEKLDEMDRCYIFTSIVKNHSIACSAGQMIARGLFRNIEW